MIEAEWRDVVGYEGLYRVSSDGRLKSLARDIPVPQYGGIWHKPEQLLKLRVNIRGYYAVGLNRDGIRRECQVHRLVAFAFHPDSHSPGAYCLHGDANRLNNNADNLRWGTHSDNMSDVVKHGSHPFANKTHCPYGHEYSPENTLRWRSNGRPHRRCRVCERAREVARYKRDGIANAGKTHCTHGHPFDSDNTYVRSLSNGQVRRICRMCNRAAQERARRKARQQAAA
jgi:hypothetical protein